ncbi:MAG: hypothetical protein PHV39_02330 [Methanomicrobium sp.]|nr:hypothetical protein [Methanomicrobium sp.]
MTQTDSDLNKKSRLFMEASIPLSVAIMLPVGVLLLLLGLLLFPVSMGLIPFSPDGQMGLLMVIMAIQMLTLGETPLGQYSRSWLLIIVGIVFAGMGIFSCIVPGILTGILQELIGFLNIAGGVILLLMRFGPAIFNSGKSAQKEEPMPHVQKSLLIILTILNFVSIGFGASMFMPGLVSGIIIAGILVLNGILLFALASVILKIENMQQAA